VRTRGNIRKKRGKSHPPEVSPYKPRDLLSIEKSSVKRKVKRKASDYETGGATGVTGATGGSDHHYVRPVTDGNKSTASARVKHLLSNHCPSFTINGGQYDYTTIGNLHKKGEYVSATLKYQKILDAEFREKAASQRGKYKSLLMNIRDDTDFMEENSDGQNFICPFNKDELINLGDERWEKYS